MLTRKAGLEVRPVLSAPQLRALGVREWGSCSTQRRREVEGYAFSRPQGATQETRQSPREFSGGLVNLFERVKALSLSIEFCRFAGGCAQVWSFPARAKNVYNLTNSEDARIGAAPCRSAPSEGAANTPRQLRSLFLRCAALRFRTVGRCGCHRSRGPRSHRSEM